MADERIDMETQHPDVHHEESDVSARGVLIGVAITVVFFVVMAVGLWGMYVGFRAVDRSMDPEVPTKIQEPAPTAPGLSEFTIHWSEPARYLEQLRKEDQEILGEYGWVDRSSGLVHVPIEVGMSLALERGYPVRPPVDEPVGSRGLSSESTDAGERREQE